MLHDPRLIAVVALNELPWLHLLEHPPVSATYTAPSELHAALVRCGTAAEAGCHPFVILDVVQLLRYRDVVIRELSRLDRRVTLVAVDYASNVVNPQGWPPALRSKLKLPGARSHVVDGRADVQKLLRQCLESPQPRLLYCPLRATASSAADATRIAARRSGASHEQANGDASGVHVARAVSAAAQRDRTLFVLATSDRPHWRELNMQVPGQSLLVTGDETREALGWAAALAELDGHLILVLRDVDLEAHAALLRDRVLAPFHAITVVIEAAAAGVAGAEQESARLVPDPGRRTTLDGTTGFSRLLDRFLGTRAPTVIVVPPGLHWMDPPAAAPGGDESNGARRGRKAVGGRRDGASSGSAGCAGSAAAASEDVRQIQQHRFTPATQGWIDAYRRVGHRDLYLWRWTAHAVDLITLSCVDPAWRAHVGETKFLTAMFNVLLDDVADRDRQPQVVLELLKRTRDGQRPGDGGPDQSSATGLACQIWDELWRRARACPRAAEFTELLQYDLRQLCNTIEYSLLIHQNRALINPVEHDLYSSHGMTVACASTLDLMCSPAFRVEELGLLREAVWHGGCMARIGNLVTTWEREIADNDFSSGVFALAVGRGWLSPADLAADQRARIEQAIRGHDLEREFTQRWTAHRACLSRLQGRIGSVNVPAYLQGLERLFHSELASRGRK